MNIFKCDLFDEKSEIKDLRWLESRPRFPTESILGSRLRGALLRPSSWRCAFSAAAASVAEFITGLSCNYALITQNIMMSQNSGSLATVLPD